MVWPEVTNAKNENRREIILSGNAISERLNKEGFDLSIYDLKSLNYLNIHETSLSAVPDGISNLHNLTTLVLHSNNLSEVNPEITGLEKLKVLDLSKNCLAHVPDLSRLGTLITLNLSLNFIENLPSFEKNTKLCEVDVSNNRLTQFRGVCHKELSNLACLKLNGNLIEEIPVEISVLSLKVLDLSSNKIKTVPGELSDCSKLKELNLKENSISDRRLYKLVEQCRTKQVMDYIKQHCPVTSNKQAQNNAKKGKKGTQKHKASEESADNDESKYKIHVKHYDDDFKIVVKDKVKEVRGHILGCLIHGMQFTEETFKKFIQLQTKLHDGICEKRNAATIATHDFKKITNKFLTYTCQPPNQLFIRPLNQTNVLSGADLFKKLQLEADALRKEKKRNTYSGIHKYLYLLEGKSWYPCLLSGDSEVISFPPITNSEVTRISLDTTSLFIEVTSALSQMICRNVLDTLLQEMLVLLGQELHVQQVRNTDVEGNLKAVYPSRSDLVYENGASISVIRENS